MKPTKEQVAKWLNYDPVSGSFRWLKSTRGASAGALAGSSHTTVKRPYRTINVCGRHCYASHIAWLLMTGRWPNDQIDHRNGDSLDDRWDNLRAATNRQNAMNRSKQSNNTTGYKGVSFDKRSITNPWVAQIKHRNIGRFPTPDEAARAYDQEAIKIFGEFASLNFAESDAAYEKQRERDWDRELDEREGGWE